MNESHDRRERLLARLLDARLRNEGEDSESRHPFAEDPQLAQEYAALRRLQDKLDLAADDEDRLRASALSDEGLSEGPAPEERVPEERVPERQAAEVRAPKDRPPEEARELEALQSLELRTRRAFDAFAAASQAAPAASAAAQVDTKPPPVTPTPLDPPSSPRAAPWLVAAALAAALALSCLLWQSPAQHRADRPTTPRLLGGELKCLIPTGAVANFDLFAWTDRAAAPGDRYIVSIYATGAAALSLEPAILRSPELEGLSFRPSDPRQLPDAIFWQVERRRTGVADRVFGESEASRR